MYHDSKLMWGLTKSTTTRTRIDISNNQVKDIWNSLKSMNLPFIIDNNITNNSFHIKCTDNTNSIVNTVLISSPIALDSIIQIQLIGDNNEPIYIPEFGYDNIQHFNTNNISKIIQELYRLLGPKN